MSFNARGCPGTQAPPSFSKDVAPLGWRGLWDLFLVVCLGVPANNSLNPARSARRISSTFRQPAEAP